MWGNFIDIFRTKVKSARAGVDSEYKYIATDFGKIRVLDTGGKKAVIINVPDGPNVIEHHEHLIAKLSKQFRVICFEFPGFGFSPPTLKYDYSLDKSARIVLDLMDSLKIERAALSFSCANGFYAINVAGINPDRFTHLFLAQTPAMHSMQDWVGSTIPKILTFPVIGQLANRFTEQKMARSWYKYALPKGQETTDYQNTAVHALKNGGCFCLAGLVQGLTKELKTELQALEIPSTMIWGSQDFTHRKTDPASILNHIPNCEIIEFKNCGHFPELESTQQYVKIINERL